MHKPQFSFVIKDIIRTVGEFRICLQITFNKANFLVLLIALCLWKKSLFLGEKKKKTLKHLGIKEHMPATYSQMFQKTLESKRGKKKQM